jgi:hypothetical protein
MVPLKGPIDFQGQLTPSNWMISFGSLILGVICNNYEIQNNLHLSWHGKVYSNTWKDGPWMTITSFVMPIDALPSSLINSNVSLRRKQRKSTELGHAPWLITLWG